MKTRLRNYALNSFVLFFLLSSNLVAREISSLETLKKLPNKVDLIEMQGELIIHVLECNKDSECGGRGVCSKENDACICFPGYLNYDCSYKQKQQLTAFFLHSLLGLGLGAADVYLDDCESTLYKMFLFWGGIYAADCGIENNLMKTSALGFSFLAASIFWWIADFVDIGFNTKLDANRMPLEGW